MNPIALLIGWGIPAKLAKPLLIGVGVLLLCLAAWGAVKIHDHGVIATHDAKQDAATAKADRTADTHAADQRRVDDSRLTNEATQTQETVNEARRTGADARAAYYRCVGLQQAARRNGLKPPACV